MVTRYSTLGGKEPALQSYMSSYSPQVRLLSAASNREVPPFHGSSIQGGGPGMRGMHHAPPTQPPTPPTSQDIKQPPAHLPPQAHQLPHHSGGQVMQYSMPTSGRGSIQQPFYPPRPPPGNQRMAPHGRPSVVVSNSAHSFMPQAVAQPVYPGHVLPTQMAGQAPVFVAPSITQSFQFQQPRHQSGSYLSTTQFLVPQHTMYTPYPQQSMYFTQSLPSMSRAGGPALNLQGAAPAQSQPPLTLIQSPCGPMMPNPGVSQTSRQKTILSIIDPKNGRNVLNDMNNKENTSSRSGESSARQTPQPNSGQQTDEGVVAELATPVAIAARVDHSRSPNPPALQKSSSRTSNYSESESQSQTSPDPQGMSTPSVSPSKLDTSVESISSESQIVENNISYDANQQATIMRGGWPQVLPGASMPMEILSMPMHPGMMIPDDMLRAGSLPAQPSREYQLCSPQFVPTVLPGPFPTRKDIIEVPEKPVECYPTSRDIKTVLSQTQWTGDGNPVSLPILMNEEPGGQVDPNPVRPERVTPVVSALAQGPTVDIGPRPQREQFPVLGKGHQQQSPVKRKQRSEPAQETAETKAKDAQSKVVTQTKHKSSTPVSESKKQSNSPSQDSDEYVQSVQTKNSEPKTIIIKKNESDSSGTKTKTDDSLIKNKENNTEETRNSNEEVVQNSNRINKSEIVKCDVPVAKEQAPPSEESPGANAVEEVPPVAVPEPEVVSENAENAVPLKTNGETTPEEDAKSNNQKSKPGNKRPGQSKMRLESKDTRNAEPDTPASIEATPPAPAAAEKTSASSNVVINEQATEKAEEETIAADEDKEKEDLIVAAKNENNKQTTSLKTNDAANTPAIANKIVLKHNYESDQWSPINPEGKKKYDRHFIMGLQNQPQSLRKPTNLPNLELLSDNNKQRPFDRNVISSMTRSHVDNIYPSFANKNSSQRGQTIPKRGSQQGKPKAAKLTVVQLTPQQDIKLRETENAWKPTRVTERANRTEEETETEALYKRVRGILNKLTPEKFNKLVAQVKDLPIDNATRLEGVIDLVFKKAVDEPSFSVAYAQMCRTLQKMEAPSNIIRADGKQEPGNFRKILLTRCQQEFEKNSGAELNRDERLKEIEMETDPEKKKMLQLAFEEEERRIRMKSVGNIRFIGELYKLQMLTGKIMHNCIAHLLSLGDEESLECLCKLLTTIGQGLEMEGKSNKGKDDKQPDLNEYFKKLADIVKNKGSGKVSSRVRFMIQDVIDLRASKWVPRRNESQPKTIDQIQKEAERENIEINLALIHDRNKRQEMRNSMDGKKRGAPDSAGWTTVTNSQPNKSRLHVDLSKMKLDQSDVEVASSLSLGNRNQFVWGPSASSGKMDDKRSISQLGANKFAVLLTPNTGNPSLKGSVEKDRINSYKSLEDDVRSSKGKNKENADSRSSSRESTSSKHDDNRFINPANNKSKVSSVPPSVSPDVPSDKDCESLHKKNCKILLDDYLMCTNLNEALKDLNDHFPPSSRKDFVYLACLTIMEMKGLSPSVQPRRALSKLMNYFLITKSISKEDFLVGLSKVLETTDDLAVDMPYLWKYIAEILVDLFAEEVITFKDIVSVLGRNRGSQGSAKFLAALVKLLIEVKNVSWLKDRWLDSEVSLTDIINEKDVKDFVNENNVEFMLGKSIKLELRKMIEARKSFDDITKWISKNVGDEKSTEPLFVRTLMTALLEAAVTQGQPSLSYKLDKELFSHYEPLIVRYTNHNEKLELPCLFAIQAFVHKRDHPQSILHNIFEHLWDTNLIAIESFKSWRDSKNPQEHEGHGICVTLLTSFFTHLDETETDEES